MAGENEMAMEVRCGQCGTVLQPGLHECQGATITTKMNPDCVSIGIEERPEDPSVARMKTVQDLAQYLMQHGVLKNEDARRMADEISEMLSRYNTGLIRSAEDWKSRAEKAEKACCQKNEALVRAKHALAWCIPTPEGGHTCGRDVSEETCRAWKEEAEKSIDLALGPDCGKDYVPRSELDRLMMMCAKSGVGDWKADYHLGELTETGSLRRELSAAKADVEKLREALRYYVDNTGDIFGRVARQALGKECA